VGVAEGPAIWHIKALSRYLSLISSIRYLLSTNTCSPFVKMALDQYTYVFVIGTLFAMLDAYNNGASE
jgi:hypothetical protein